MVRSPLVATMTPGARLTEPAGRQAELYRNLPNGRVLCTACARNCQVGEGQVGFCGIRGNPYPWAEHRDNAQDAIDLVRKKLAGGCDVLILDEINNALELKLVDLEQVLDILRCKPPLMHLVLTGRNAHKQVLDFADTASEIREIKHAYRKGIEPQPGIDY